MNINQIVLPFDIGIIIPDDAPVRTLHFITERLDYTKLNSMYYMNGLFKTYKPKLLFQLILLAYMNRIYSSRKIEDACKANINFMWLLQGHKIPDHNTFNRFRQEVGEVINDLFTQFNEYLIVIGEIKKDHIFIDGTKLESFANKYSFVWKKSTNKHDARLNEKIKESIEKVNVTYQTKFRLENNEIIKEINEVLGYLNLRKESLNITFVYGKGKRKTQLQRDIELYEEFLEKKLKYTNYLTILSNRNSFSKTDPDATFMHMKEDHMRNSQLKPGYNIQAAASGGYCVGVDVFSERSDQLTLIPFLIHLEDMFGFRFKDIVADAGYESEEIYKFLEENDLNSYIKPTNYERSKKRSYKKKISLRENMDYDAENDIYTCKNNRQLTVVGTKQRKSKSGYVSKVKVYECESCENCDLKPKCTKAKKERQIHVSEEFIRLRNESTDNISTEKGRKLRMNRSIQIEGLFGVIKEDYGFRRLLTKGKKNVSAEVKLLMFALNINKFHSKKVRNTLGFKFYGLKAG